LLLGLLAAALTLSGMLLGSLLTGKYAFDRTTINLAQAVFSLTPGIWEEVFYRGVIMIVLLRTTNSFRKAAIIQVIIFGLAHIKGLNVAAFVDVFSVILMAIAFTYLAYRTRSLIPGIVFHYLHDTFLFAVQIPGGQYTGLPDQALFYGGLWLAIGLVLVVTKFFTRHGQVVNGYDFYGEVDRSSGYPSEGLK
jgi:membrane protease YdiL (CAAX protease family)